MPSYWYTWSKVKPSDTDTEEIATFKERNRKIVANKKPYFMKHIYSDLSRRTKNYKRNAELKSMMLTGELFDTVIKKTDLNDDEKNFLDGYYNGLPITYNGCTMNRLCHIAEGLLKRVERQKEDKSIDFGAVFRSKIDSGITENRLVTSGVYALCRNPIYTAFMFFCTGALFISGNLFFLSLLFFYWLFMTILMKNTEEKWLLELYGKEYADYCKRVNRCIHYGHDGIGCGVGIKILDCDDKKGN